jgi:hypothetical protein
MLQRFNQPTHDAGGMPGSVLPNAQVQAAAGAAGSARGSQIPMLDVSIQRLEEIIDFETSALRNRQAIDLKEFNDRKSQALLELTRSLRAVQGTGPNPAVAERVAGLKTKLAINQAMLKIHLEAVREIATTLSDAIRHSDSDGTYTPAISAYAKRP